MTTALSKKDEAFTVDEIVDFLRRRIDAHLLDVTTEYETVTLHLDAEGYTEAARILKEEDRLAFTMFDCLFGIDAREDGFDVVTVLYSVETGLRMNLRHRCAGGRENPVAPTLTDLFHGANFHEREAWDMFGIEFTGHPGLAPRILCAENFEGWPLRKDFHLASREAKPWPGVKEPAELDEDGNVIEKIPGPGEAVGPTALDEAMAKQAKLANPSAEPDEPAEAEEAVDAAAPTEDSAAAPELTGETGATGSDARAKAEEQRKAAAEARAERAADQVSAAEAPVAGDIDAPVIPQGDPSTMAADPAAEDTASADEPAEAGSDEAGDADTDREGGA